MFNLNSIEPPPRDNSLKQSRKSLFRHLRQDIRSRTVVRAMEQVPRELFVPAQLRELAYSDVALGIGQGQTISQPYIVAIMTEALELRGNERVLEVGTGSGYQAAVLSVLLPRGELISVERVPSLRIHASELLRAMGYNNVSVEPAGPTLGAPHLAPFDAIIVTAASPQIPVSLTDQLAVGGRLVIPVGSLERQELVQARRTEEGISIRWLESCRFVPLIGNEAFPG